MKNFYYYSRNSIERVLSLLMLLLCIALGAKANPVDMMRAREVGAKFINANTAIKMASYNDLQLVTTYHTSNNDAAFHVFNTPKGFVIVSANDCATPILGYSEEGHFDVFNIPVQMQGYLQGFVEQIQYGIDNHMVADETIAHQWELVQSTGLVTEQRATTVVTPLLTDTWGQGCYYNSLCPEDPNGSCGHVVTGCVATSMAQIMHYWGYPSVGTGSHTYTPSGYSTQTANFGATTYQWANMPNSLSSSSSSTQINAVATLMWHCGVAVNMMYGAGASGAYSEDVATALVNYFGYSNQLTGIYRDYYSNSEWLNMIKNSLDLGRPVHYSGNDGSGQSGHAFVCDGYDSNNFLHFNWGWNGYYNNYFAVDALTPADGNYSFNNFAIINIFPNCTSGSYQVNATASPSYGGTVNGAGSYDCGDGCTLTAIPADGYMFCSWTEGGATVSNEPTYSFTVMGNRNLVANFVDASSGSCSLVFTFNDSYGDGWNGNYLTLNYSEGCNSYEELTLDNGLTTTITRNVVDGSHIVMGWIEGSWSNECSFTVSYANGNIIYSGSSLNSGFSYEFDVNCGGTPPGPGDPIYVTTYPTNRNVILEEFTGRGCGYCTDGHRIANEIMAANPNRVWAINVHAGGYAYTSYPNMITQDGNTIHNGFDISGYPTGVVNRSTADGQSRSYWGSIANTQMSQVAECNVGGEVSIDPVTRTASITVEVYYTGNSSYSQNYLTVAMLQDSILGSQADYGNYNPTQWVGDQYCHMHVLRDVVTSSAWGDAISPTTQGSLITRTYTYQIPETIGSPNGVDVDLNNIYFLAWVSETYQGTPTRPILTACKLGDSSEPFTTYNITATANPANGGSVSGAGSYVEGTTCTLMATAYYGFSFTNWTMNGITVSTDPTYSFVVTEDANYVANFSNNGNIIEIGDGTNSTYMVPFNSLYEYSFTEQVFLSNEIGTQGQITSISFDLNSTYITEQTNEIALYMKNVGRDSFSMASDYEPVTVNDLVYSGLWTIPANYSGWITINLDSPFAYDGTSNLMIAMHEMTPGYSTRNFKYTEVTNSGLSYYSDNYNPDPYDLDSYLGTKNVRSVRNNVQLSFSDNNNSTVDFETGDFSQADFNNTVSSYPWIIWSDNANSGNYCMASSNNYVQSSESFIDVTADFIRDGYISFFSRISSESGWDYGRFYIDGNEMFNESGVSGWTNYSYDVSAGSHTFRWYYGKDGSVDSNEDRYFIDDIYFDGVSTEVNFVVTPNPINLGYRPNNAWMRPLEVNVFNEGASTTIDNVSVTNDYFQLDLGNVVVPFVLSHDNGFDFSLGTVGTASGTVNANLIINYGDDEEAEYDVTAIAYNPVSPDVWELAQTVNSFPYTATLNSANHPLYNNYRLPPTGIVDGADAVYKLVFTEDTYLNASVTIGENGKVALYPEDFNGVGGPDLYNYYNGPEMAVEDWLYYDNGEYATGIGASGSEFWWGIKLDVSAYAGASLTKVSVYDYAYMEGDVMIYQTEGTPYGEPAQQQSISLTGSSQFVEFVLNTPYTIDASQPLWIVMHYISGDSWPAAASNDTGDPNGRWVSLDNYDWQDLTNYGLNYTWMLRGFVTNASGRTIALVSNNNRDDDVLFLDDFENGLDNWTLVDADADGNDWQIATPAAYGIGDAHSGTYCASSWSWNSYTLYPDNYMISPLVDGATSISYYVATNTVYPDHYAVMASSTGTNISNFVTVYEEDAYRGSNSNGVRSSMAQGSNREMSTWAAKSVTLPAGTKYVAFRHYNSDDMNYLFIDDVTILSSGGIGNINNMTVTPGTYYLVASSTSNEWTVEINTDEVPCPDPAYNPSPANYAEVNPNRTIELSWQFGPRTTEYKLMFGTTENCEQTLVDWTRELSRHYTLPALYDEMTYYWKIVERNDGCDAVVESPVWSFTTRLNTPQNLYAEQDFIIEGNSAVLYWSAPNRALQYYNVYQDGVLIGNTTDTYYVVDGLTYNMYGYEFYVTGVFDAGESDPSNDVWIYVSGLGTVNGHVYEQDGTTGIENATVSFTGYDEYGYYNTYSFITDANGYYEGSLRAGSYVAVASHAGYQDKSYGSSIAIAFNNLTSGININLDEVYKPVTEVIAEYYPDAENPESPYVKVNWSNNLSGWHTYCESEFNNAVSSNVGQENWAYEYPLDVLEPYIGSRLTKVALFSDNMYGAVGGNYTCTIYVGGDVPEEGTAVSTITVDVPQYMDEWVEYDLINPVSVTGNDPIWVVWTANTKPGGYPAGCCDGVNDLGTWWRGGDGYSWEHLSYGTWTMKNYFSTLGGRTVALTYNPSMLSKANANRRNRSIVNHSNNSGATYAAINPNPERIPLKVEEPDRSFQYYRVYRTNAYNNGPYTEDNTVLLADNVTDTLLIDVSWQDAEAGVYKWGVSRVYEGNRESEISWGELRRSLSIPKRNPLGRVLNITQEPNAGQAPAFDVPEHTDLPILRASNSEAIVVRNSNYGFDFCQFVLNDPFDLNSYGLSNDAFTRGACYMNGTIYFADNDNKFGKFDPETGVTIIATNTPFDMIEYNPVNGKIYGTDTWNGELYEVNPVNGSYTYIATIPSSFLMTFTITNDGRFILCDANEECIKEYDLETGELIPLIYVDWDVNYGQDFAIDRETNEIYWAALNNTENTYPLIKVNLADYSLTTLGYFETQVSGFAITDANLIQIERESAITWSNFLDKDMYLNNGDVNLTVALNSGDSPAGTMVSFTNLNTAEQLLYPIDDIVLGGTGYYAWDSFRKGDYQVTITKEGYETISEQVSIWDATSLSYVLEETTQKPSNLYVSSTGWAKWNGMGDDLNQIISLSDSFSFDFDDGIPEGWTTIDADGDGYTWVSSMNPGNYHNAGVDLTGTGHNSSAAYVISGSWANGTGQILYPDNYLVSPQVTLGAGSTFCFWACAQDASYAADHFGVAVSDNGADWSMVDEWTMTAKGQGAKTLATRSGNRAQGNWYYYTVNLSAYAGQKYIAIRHFNCSDQFIINVDDIELTNGRNGSRHYEYNQVVLTDLQGNVLYTENTTNKFCQLPVNNLEEGQTYHCKVASVYSSGLTEWAEVDWVYQACDNYEGANGLNATTTGNGNLVSWTYPEIEREGKAARGSVAYACDFDHGNWISYDIDNPLNATTLNNIGYLYGGDYCGFDGYVYSSFDYNWYKIELQTGNIVEQGDLSLWGFYDCTWDYSTNTMYGTLYSDLYIWNLETKEPQYIGNMGYDMEVLVCNLNGDLYGIATGSPANVYRINKTDASVELVGSTGQTCDYYWQSGSIDYYTGKFYWTNVYSDGNFLAEVDMQTGEATVLYNGIGNQTSFCVPYEGDLFVLGAMVYRDNQLVGFTRDNSYLDEGNTSNHQYTIRVVYGGPAICPDNNIYYSMSCPQTVSIGSGDQITQVSNLAQGWNWWSTYVEQNGIDGLTMLENSLGANGYQIKSQTDFVTNYGSMWFGMLSSINNEETYMIDNTSSCQVVLTGAPVTPSDHPITVSSGWNWIGYPCTNTMSVSEAFSGYTPANGDQVKSQSDYAMYFSGMWIGQLQSITPGTGLMYLSNNATSTTLVYPDGGRSTEIPTLPKATHWTNDIHAYPHNMTVMAVVELDDVELTTDNYELSAFDANGECRGSAKLTYMEPLNRYVAFLTIAGNDAVELNFGLYNMETGREYYNMEEALVYATNATIGTPEEPYVVSFRSTTGLEELDNSVQIFPNPAQAGERINILTTVDSKHPIHVEIVNALGATVAYETSKETPASIVAPLTSGIYTVRIITEDKGIQCRKLIVR